MEKRAVEALLRVKMPMQSWHRSYRSFLLDRLRNAPLEKLLTKQRADLWFLVWTYRRQVEDFSVKAQADEIVNGAKSLAF